MSELESLCNALEASVQPLPALADSLRQRGARLRSLAAEVQQARSRVRCNCGHDIGRIVHSLDEAASAMASSAQALLGATQQSRSFIARTVAGGSSAEAASGDEDQAHPQPASGQADVPGSPREQVEQRFPSEQAERRAERWQLQGENDLGYENTCALASIAAVLSEVTGTEVTENQVVNFAAVNEYCITELSDHDESSDPKQCGGASPENVRQILEGFGADCLLDGLLNLERLASFVDSGDCVLACMDVSAYGPSYPDQQHNSRPHDDNSHGMAPPDHVVWVTGVSRDPNSGAVTGFYINDPTRLNGAGLFLTNTEMRDAWERRLGLLIVVSSTESIHLEDLIE